MCIFGNNALLAIIILLPNIEKSQIKKTLLIILTIAILAFLSYYGIEMYQFAKGVKQDAQQLEKLNDQNTPIESTIVTNYMEKLPKGITGFWKIEEQAPPSISPSLIKNIVDQLQKEALFKTIVLSEPQADTNFYVISVFTDKEAYYIGINASYPFYCGIKSMQDWTTIEFSDLPKSVTDILKSELTELKTDFLNKELKKEHLTLLSKTELEQIEYWETEKIGNVIFNKYD